MRLCLWRGCTYKLRHEFGYFQKQNAYELVQELEVFRSFDKKKTYELSLLVRRKSIKSLPQTLSSAHTYCRKVTVGIDVRTLHRHGIVLHSELTKVVLIFFFYSSYVLSIWKTSIFSEDDKRTRNFCKNEFNSLKTRMNIDHFFFRQLSKNTKIVIYDSRFSRKKTNCEKRFSRFFKEKIQIEFVCAPIPVPHSYVIYRRCINEHTVWVEKQKRIIWQR